MYECFDIFMKLCTSFNGFISKMQRTCIMRKYKVLQLGLQLGFLVAMNTLCYIQYRIYSAIHMQLYAASLQLISMSNFHTQSNVTNEMPTWFFIHSSTEDIC
jgi:hypothetical protein